jgi:cytochrome c553
MSVIAKNMSDEDIADLAAWYSSIQITAQMPE